MRLARVVILLNLALVIGLFLGYLAWGRPLAALERELALAREPGPPPGLEQLFTAQGVVRALIPELSVVVLSHGEIAGFMPAMTMGFRTQDPALLRALTVGDNVRVTLRGIPPNVVITELAKLDGF